MNKRCETPDGSALDLTRANKSEPIVDVRFDAPYKQIASSAGDEWAPTWGRDDVLYTGNDDGASFGDMPSNPIAFGRLEGDDPYDLVGTTINPMKDYREPDQIGPESAIWKTVDTCRLNGLLYRFVPISEDGRTVKSCVAASGDSGKTWTNKTIDPLFRNPKFSSPSFISFRKGMEALLGDKADDYLYAASYAGVVDDADTYVVGRVPKAAFSRGEPADWSFQHFDGSWTPNVDEVASKPNGMGVGPDGANWKTMNSYSVDGALYMFVTRCHGPLLSGDPQGRHVFRDSSIIKSLDNGRTWMRPVEANLGKPMFPGMRFGAPYFVWYGKDGAASVDNADRYVYAVSNDGYFENGDDYILGRVPRSKLADLSAADWSYYESGDGMQESSWTSIIDKATPILINRGRSGMTGITYVEGLRRYIMVVWHYHRDNFVQAIKEKDLGTVLDFFEAPKPWGPWKKVKEIDTGRMGWYAPIIGQRFQTVVDPETVRGFLYTTGLHTKPLGGLDMALYKFNYLPITLSTRPLLHADPTFVGAQ